MCCLPPMLGSVFPCAEMSCLMEALQDKRVRLQPECKKRLQDRIEMWSYAAKVGHYIHTNTGQLSLCYMYLYNTFFRNKLQSLTRLKRVKY